MNKVNTIFDIYDNSESIRYNIDKNILNLKGLTKNEKSYQNIIYKYENQQHFKPDKVTSLKEIS